jgi:hypothetical protein
MIYSYFKTSIGLWSYIVKSIHFETGPPVQQRTFLLHRDPVMREHDVQHHVTETSGYKVIEIKGVIHSPYKYPTAKRLAKNSKGCRKATDR